MSANLSIERTTNIKLRLLLVAAHVKRWNSGGIPGTVYGFYEQIIFRGLTPDGFLNKSIHCPKISFMPSWRLPSWQEIIPCHFGHAPSL